MPYEMPQVPWRPKTRFVQDRLRETRFSDRRYIAALLRAESLLDGHPIQGFATSVLLHTLRTAFPVECACIRSERQEGVLTV